MINPYVDNLIKGTWKEKHKQVIEQIIEGINNRSTDYILKGGTALMLCYDLTRFSEDIDLDSTDRQTIFVIVKHLCEVNNYLCRIAKQTETVSRIMINYGGNKPLKVEVSHRRAFIPEEEICIRYGIRVYRLNNLAVLKANAYAQRDKLRDLFDICYLVNNKYSDLDTATRSVIRTTVEYKGFEQFDYITREQSDDLIDNGQLASDFIDMYNNLGLLYSKQDVKEKSLFDAVKV